MKYMKIGTRPDTFYTDEAIRTVLSDVPTDLVIQINNSKYLLHKFSCLASIPSETETCTGKMSQEIRDSANHSYHLEGRITTNHSNFPLLLKCGLLQRLSSDSSASAAASLTSSPIILSDFPGSEDVFELCAKFCYNISVTLSAHNFLPVFSAATFLLMTDSVSRPNLLPKLHTFFLSFILPNWKDSVVTLVSSSHSSPPFTEPTIIRPLIDSIISKILTPMNQVTWSFTYSRQLSQSSSVPKDWWTEDIADLDLNHFRSIILAIRLSKILPPALIGEALHVYTVKNLPDPNQMVVDLHPVKNQRVLEAVVSMVPRETGAVSGGFLMRLLKIVILVEASASVRAELVRRAGRQLDEVSVRDLVFYRGHEREEGVIDFGVVEAVVESYFEGFRRRAVDKERVRMTRAARVFDEYLGLIAAIEELRVEKFVEMAELVPEMAREEHDGLYRAIDTFLEEHPDLSKAERKQLCQLIDCRKLSPEVRSQAIANDRLPLRTLVQLLFVEQERAGGTSGGQGTTIARMKRDQPRRSRQEEQEEHRHHRQGRRHQQAGEPTQDGRGDDGVRTSNNVINGEQGRRVRSEAKPQQPKGRGEADVEKMANRPG